MANTKTDIVLKIMLENIDSIAKIEIDKMIKLKTEEFAKQIEVKRNEILVSVVANVMQHISSMDSEVTIKIPFKK